MTEPQHVAPIRGVATTATVPLAGLDATMLATLRESAPVLRRVFQSPQIESSLARSMNMALGVNKYSESDCGGDLAVVIVALALA
jgi:hypothetical protein